jgi:tRNA G18 (ribose-2'-O)-methylase SpoU
MKRPQLAFSGLSDFRKTKKIESASNDHFKMLMSLHGAKGIRKQGLSIISGQKQVKEILSFFPDRCEGILFEKGHKLDDPVYSDKIRLFELAPDLFRELDLYGTGKPLVLIRVEPMPVWNGDPTGEGCTLLVPFQDPANVGAVIRSAAAFGVKSAVILKEAAHPFHPKSIRAAGSTIMRMEFYEGPSIRELPKGLLPHVLLSPGGEDISGFEFPESFCLVPGLEGQGLPEHLRNMELVSVPMEDGVESLNAAVATGIALFMWRNRAWGKGS